MNFLHDFATNNNFDFFLIVLSFAAGRVVPFKDTIYLTIFIIKVMKWGLLTLPDSERAELKAKLDIILNRLSLKHTNKALDALDLKHDSQSGGIG